jgi:type IV secretory pathway TrbL component
MSNPLIVSSTQFQTNAQLCENNSILSKENEGLKNQLLVYKICSIVTTVLLLALLILLLV